MRHRFPLCFLVSAVFTLLVGVLAPARYETLDDVMINQLLRAGEESVFFGLIPGRMVRGLLALCGNHIAVYPAFQLALTALAFALILHWAFTHGRALGRFAPWILTIAALSLQTRFVVQFTFTNTSTLLCSALALVLAGRRTPLRTAPAFALGIALGFAYLIRSDSGKLALLIAAPALVWILWSERRLHRTAALAVIGFALMLGGERQLYLHGTTQAFRDYTAFNAVRGKLHMYERLYARKNFDQVLRENQWSPTDYEMFATWLPADERVYTVQTLSTIDRLTALTLDDRLKAANLPSALQLLRLHADAFLALALLGALGLALARERPVGPGRAGFPARSTQAEEEHRAAWEGRSTQYVPPARGDARPPPVAAFLFLSTLAVTLLLVVMHFWMRLPRRVSDPAVVGAAVTALIILTRGRTSGISARSESREEDHPVQQAFLPAEAPCPLEEGKRQVQHGSKPTLFLLGITGLLALLLQARTILTLRADNRENQARIDRQFDHFTQLFPGKILFLKTNGFFEPAHDNPFRDRHEPFERLSFTWMTQSPFFYATLKRLFGVEHGADYFPALVENPRVVFVCQPEFTELLPRHLRERHNLETRFEEIAPPFEEFRFYRLIR